MSEKRFVDGLIFSKPGNKAPEYVIGKISIKKQELIDWLAKEREEWINIDVLMSKAGKPYMIVNDWKPEKKEDPIVIPGLNDKIEDEIDIDSIPF